MKFKNNKRWIFVSLLVLLIITLIIIITYKKIGFIYNTNIKDLKNSQEQESISMDVEIKNVQDNINKCLITFTCNDENEKIKSIQYPGEENNVININNEEGRQKVAIDYEIENGKEDNTFRVTTTSGEVVEKRTIYTIHYDVNGEDASISNGSKTELKGRNTELNEIPTREGYIFFGWSKNIDSKIPEYRNEKYIYQKGDEDITLYAIWIEKIAANSIIEGIEQISETAYKSINVNNETYSTNAIVYDGDLVLDGSTQVSGAMLSNNIYEFGDKTEDVANASKDAKNMVIFKVKGNLTIKQGITLTACKNDMGYGGPKGLFIYCTGTLINDGTISMTARGARAEGQNVYLFKNTNGSYEYVPDVGCLGGDMGIISNQGITLEGDGDHRDGSNGQNAGEGSRKTGGGGSGKVFSYTGYNRHIYCGNRG